MPAVADAPVVRLAWNPVQTRFLLATEPYVDLEGAVRAGKTEPLCWKVLTTCVERPGLHAGLTRWTQDGLDAQLKPRWRDTLRRAGIRPTWQPHEEYDELPNGSRVYLRALKASEETMRYGKLAGLTLSLLGVDQAEEVPEDVYRAYVPARLSQVGFPHQVLLTPNPPPVDHWIAKEFPEHNNRAGHLYLLTSVYDNRVNLGEDYIAALEAAYPPGHLLRRKFIEGRRGLRVAGTPVYAPLFTRATHVQPIEPNPDVPIVEAWDFGHHHPAVSWVQFLPWGQLAILGELLGEDQFIEDFAPLALQRRRQLFPRALEFWSCCDPAGTAQNSHGTNRSAADVLIDNGIHPASTPGANLPEVRDTAIQAIGRYLLRTTGQGPGLIVHPRCTVIVDALEAGYVWNDRTPSVRVPNVRMPKKDGYYDHLMNTLEYAVLQYGPAALDQKSLSREQRKLDRRLQRDTDDVDGRTRRGPRHIRTGLARRRGGY